ncbi:SAM-dependent methyltransferase [Kribbella antibiotica]|uniref:SAM-dependent methyltransferase n=1 Tax=Kribbella antibiotica TaxID=190195 RepID=A0A4R4ZG70_9ACTN|nr:methyltransferase domain-containing protein [Kribbella antibiotica]TDD57050.1 SAM-dependent methyltransferase [Kribbella antibiotica]
MAAGEPRDGTDQGTIARVYDEHAAAEYERLDRSLLHRAEFVLTAELLDEFVAPGAEVLDAGSGPGRYAEYLLGKGCRVGLTDLSVDSLRLFEQRVDRHLAGGVLFCRQGSATDLGWLSPESFDAVLLMGPLYHLVTLDERRAALREARRVLRPGGVLVAAYVSPYRPLMKAVEEGARHEVERLRAGGPTMHLEMQQYRGWPREAHATLAEAGFEVLRTRNLQGFAALMDRDTIESQDPEGFFAMLRATCELPDLLGATLHFVCVARRPDEAL